MVTLVGVIVWIHSTLLLTCLNCVHFSCGLNSQSIKIYNVSNNASLNPIQYHTGFMGQKIDKTKCLAFHPNRLWLAVSSNDMLLSSYTWEKRK